LVALTNDSNTFSFCEKDVTLIKLMIVGRYNFMCPCKNYIYTFYLSVFNNFTLFKIYIQINMKFILKASKMF